jgi:NhaP-type Na+/H+ or K+/H+ antiporter
MHLLSTFKNAILLFLLSCAMPETRALDTDSMLGKSVWVVYQLVMPVTTTLVLNFLSSEFISINKKEEREKSIHIEIASYLLCPIICFLLAETLETSGLLALVVCGIF